jgi:GT2 family glycosyltransferase
MTDIPSVAIIVPVFNNKEHTRELLESLKNVTYSNYKVIIIDDGSSDGTSEMIIQEYNDVILLRGDGNLWSSGSINLGIARAIEMDFEYSLIIDNDILVDRDFVTTLVNTAVNNPRSIVVPKTYQYQDRNMIEAAGYQVRKLGLEIIPTGEGEQDIGQYDETRDIPYAMTMMLMRTSIFTDIGMFDAENLPLYGADMDFSLRASKNGYRIIYEPRSKLWHKRHTSVGKETPDAGSIISRLKYLTLNYKSSLYWRAYRTITFRHIPRYLVPIRLLIYLRLLISRILRNDLT